MTNLPHLDDGTTEIADVEGAIPSARARAWASALARVAPLIAVIAGVLLFAYRWSSLEVDVLRGLIVDDAYISARHAQNLVEGHGLNFNADERVEGYTNFLFTLLLAIPPYLDIALEPFVRAIGALSALGVVALTMLIARPIVGRIVAVLLGLALVADARFVFFSMWGLETIFTCLPYLLGMHWMFQRRHSAGSAALAAAMLTRMDMALIVAPVLLYALALAWLDRRERPLGAAIGAILLPITGIFGTYFVLRWGYYGWMLPNTFYAKVGSPANAWHRGATYVHECLVAMGISGIVYASVGAWLVVGVLAIWFKRRTPPEIAAALGRALTVLGCATAYLAYTTLVGGDHFQERFIYHAIPVLLIACLAPWSLLASAVASAFPSGKRLYAGTAALAASLVVLLAQAPHRFGTYDALAGWVSLGRYLKERAPVGAVLATDAAGALPYFSGLKSLDILGLANTTIAHRTVPELGSGIAGHEKSDPKYIVEQRPDFISTWVDPDGGAGRGLSGVPGFDALYRIAAVVRIDVASVSSERILPFANEPSRAELIALAKGTGKVPGMYAWGLYARRQDRDYRRLPTSQFKSNLRGWQPNSEFIVQAPRGHDPAHIMYGPFIEFSQGNHMGYLRLRSGSTSDVDPRQRLCAFDVFNGQRSIAELSISVGEAQGSTANFPFSFDISAEDTKKPIEFRLYCYGLSDVTVESVHVR
jgi:hypothetical protein